MNQWNAEKALVLMCANSSGPGAGVWAVVEPGRNATSGRRWSPMPKRSLKKTWKEGCPGSPLNGVNGSGEYAGLEFHPPVAGIHAMSWKIRTGTAPHMSSLSYWILWPDWPHSCPNSVWILPDTMVYLPVLWSLITSSNEEVTMYELAYSEETGFTIQFVDRNASGMI